MLPGIFGETENVLHLLRNIAMAFPPSAMRGLRLDGQPPPLEKVRFFPD
jgi:hypothetical protein